MSENTIEMDIGLPTTGKEMLNAMCGMYGYTLSRLEAAMWTLQVLHVYSDEQIIRACIAHMESPPPASNFMPKYGAIKSLIAPPPSFLHLERAVRQYGPYATPAIDDPVIVEAINQLGGWERVCAEMPDSSTQTIDFNQYMRRAETALVAARRRVSVEGAQPQRVLGAVDRARLERTDNLKRLGHNDPNHFERPRLSGMSKS